MRDPTDIKPSTGLVISCALIPAIYAGLTYWYVVQYGEVPPKNDPLTLAALIALPLVVAGVTKWWDVWIIEPPKVGCPWKPKSPTEFVVDAVKWHTIAIVVCAVAHLTFNQGLAEMFSKTTLTLDVPQAKARLREVEAELGEARSRLANAQERSEKPSFPANDFGGFSADPAFADAIKMQASVDINQLTSEQESLARQLGEHEQKVNVLKEKGKVPGDHYSPFAFAMLWLSAIGYSLRSTVKKKSHSGQGAP